MTDPSEGGRPGELGAPRLRRNTRPRDALGRPLPYGTEGGVPGQPPMAGFDPEAALAEAQRLLDAGLPFHAHEVLEDTWKAAPEDQRALWKSLAQFAVGITHARRGNQAGALALIRRAADGLPSTGAPYGVDADALRSWARRSTAQLAAGGGLPALHLRGVPG